MNKFRPPRFDKISNQWFVEEVDIQEGRVVSFYNFYEESDARTFYLENDIKSEWFSEMGVSIRV